MSCHKAQESSYSIDYFHGRHDAYFLTHVHTDHLNGLHDGWKRGTIYCSEQTSKLLFTLFSIDCDVVRTLPLDCPSMLKLSRNTYITVTLVDANHCPGSVMIKISGEFGCRLHSGDFRYSTLHHCGEFLYGIQNLFLDTTFFHPSWRMPTKEQSCSRLLDLIEREGHNKIIYIAADCYGQEDIFIAIYERYGQKIMLDVDHPGVSGRTKSIWKSWLTKVDCLQNVVTKDEPSRFRACASNGKGVNKRLRDSALNIFALAKREGASSLLIRASTLWFGSRDRFENHEKVERWLRPTPDDA